MKTHYWVLMFNVIINIIMACSLNSFSNSTLYLPVFFLYFLSNLAVFIEKYVSYKDRNQWIEQMISGVCVFLSGAMVFLYISNSINITAWVFGIAFIMPIAYGLLIIAAYFREMGYSLEMIGVILLKKKRTIFFLALTSVILGGLGSVHCHFKYIRKCEGYGSPQYFKYFGLIFIISLIFELCILVRCNKGIYEQTVQEKEKERVNESETNIS